MKKILISLAILLGLFATSSNVSARKFPTYKVKVDYLGTNQKLIALSKTLTYKTKAKKTLKAKSIPGYTPVKKQITFKPKNNLKLNFVYKIAKVKKPVAKSNSVKSFTLNLKPTDTPTEGCQWSSRNITYRIDPNTPQEYKNSYNIAINNWNAVGIVKLVPTTAKFPDIYMTEGNYSPQIIATDAYACTSVEQDCKALPDSLVSMTNDTITMFCDKLSMQPLSDTTAYHVEVSEHEIGHALGLAHNLSGFENSVMNAPIWFETNGKYCGITQNDIDTIKQMYGWIK